jgi:hypothetical protein
MYTSLGPTEKDFRKFGCDVNSCRVVDKTSFPVSQANDADSIVFNTKDLYAKKYPARQRRDQIWLSWLMEAPLHWMPVSVSKLNDLFNLTLSYLNHTDTDIHIPYGKVERRAGGDKYKMPSVDFVQNKTKMAAWVVSNCKSKGQRRQYVDELSKYIQVDIYGYGGLNCSRNTDLCFKKIEKDYKFYLAFESMFCEQYVTEKFFRTLRYNIIPVTLGGAEYARHAPAQSYINVRDYKSPQKLAEFLIALSKDSERYMEYFKWKEQWQIRGKSGICELCRILHIQGYPYKTGFNMGEYWNAAKHCKSGKAEKKLLHLE